MTHQHFYLINKNHHFGSNFFFSKIHSEMSTRWNSIIYWTTAVMIFSVSANV